MATRYRIALLWPALLGCIWAAGAKAPPAGRGESEAAEITATVYTDKAAIAGLIGHPLDGDYIVVDLSIAPKADKPLALLRDDFLLRSDRDGQKCRPFEPGQIAGEGTLIVSNSSSGGAIMGEESGPVWGGTIGQPGRLGGSGASIGNAGESGAQGTVQTGGKIKANPTLEALKRKILPEKQISQPVSGLLYFFLEGKHKPKDLELIYKGGGGRIAIRFK